MSNIYKGVILFSNRDEDTSDNPFIWGSLISKNPKDESGNAVKNPGGLMFYGAKGIGTGDCKQVLVKSRGLGGLYDVIPAETHEMILQALGLKIEEVPEIPVVESQATSRLSREDARQKAREHRQSRRAARAISTSPAMVEAQPE